MYLDQFGSLCAEPDTTGAILMAVQRDAKASLRVANLLDEESDEDAPSAPTEVLRVKETERPPQSVLEETSSLEKDDDMEEGRRRFLREDPRVLAGGVFLWEPRRIQLFC